MLAWSHPELWPSHWIRETLCQRLLDVPLQDGEMVHVPQELHPFLLHVVPLHQGERVISAMYAVAIEVGEIL
jgi:hypothetical protein